MVLRQLIKREVKAFIKNPAFIISLIMIIAVYGMVGGVMRVGVEEAARTVRETGIGLVVEGSEEDLRLVQVLIALLNGTRTTGVVIKLYDSVEKAMEDTSICAVIPRGFAENITSGNPVVLFKGFIRADNGLALFRIQAKIETLNTLARLFEAALPTAISITYGEPPPREVKVAVSTDALFYGKKISANALMALLSTATFLPVIVAIIMGSNAGYAAQLVAFEKVEKAFEMLLSQPIRRSYIVLAKIIGASIATVMFALVYVASLLVMLTGIIPGGLGTGGLPGIPQYYELSVQLGIDVGYIMVATLALSVMVGLLSSGSLGMVLGALSPDERTAGVLITPIMLLYIGVGFASTFLGIELNVLYAVLSGVTVVAMPTMYVLSAVAGKPFYALISITSAVAACLMLTVLAIVIFNKEIIVLGIRLGTRRLRQS